MRSRPFERRLKRTLTAEEITSLVFVGAAGRCQLGGPRCTGRASRIVWVLAPISPRVTEPMRQAACDRCEG